jgi:hypothetical protein
MEWKNNSQMTMKERILGGIESRVGSKANFKEF